MEFILVKNNTVINRVECVNLDFATSIFKSYDVYEDSEKNYNIGDSYTN